MRESGEWDPHLRASAGPAVGDASTFNTTVLPPADLDAPVPAAGSCRRPPFHVSPLASGPVMGSTGAAPRGLDGYVAPRSVLTPGSELGGSTDHR